MLQQSVLSFQKRSATYEADKMLCSQGSLTWMNGGDLSHSETKKQKKLIDVDCKEEKTQFVYLRELPEREIPETILSSLSTTFMTDMKK